jgi:hypothetical protein
MEMSSLQTAAKLPFLQVVIAVAATHDDNY